MSQITRRLVSDELVVLAPPFCQKVEPRLHQLAKERQGPVSLLAVQALVEVLRAKLLQEPGERSGLARPTSCP